MVFTKKHAALTKVHPLVNPGIRYITPPDLITVDRAPEENDYDNFQIGAMWIDRSSTPAHDVFILVKKAAKVATWIKFVAGTGDVTALRADDANIAYPLNQIINVAGGTLLETTATVANTLTVDVTDGTTSQIIMGGGGTGANWGTLTSTGGTVAIAAGGVPYTINLETVGGVPTVAQIGTDAGIATPVGGQVDILGGANINTAIGAGPPANDIFINITNGTDGQVLIGGGVDATWSTLTAGSGIAIVNAPNSITISALTVPITTGYQNLGLEVDLGLLTITVTSADGTALSALNTGVIAFPSKLNPGTFVNITLTADISMDWSDMDGNTMGTETGRTWNESMPMYLYAVLNDAENACTFGLARVPHHKSSGLLANIGTPVVTNANSDQSLFLFDSVTVGDYDNNPVVVLGSVTVLLKTALDEWSFGPNEAGRTGIGAFHVGERFNMPLLQNGSINDCLYSAVAPPQFNSVFYVYTINPDGSVYISSGHSNMSAIGAAGINTLHLMIPVGPINRAGGTYSLSSIISSTASGLYKTIPTFFQLAGGFYGMEFVQTEPTRLSPVRFNLLVTSSGGNFSGSSSYIALSNLSP